MCTKEFGLCAKLSFFANYAKNHKPGICEANAVMIGKLSKWHMFLSYNAIPGMVPQKFRTVKPVVK